MRSITMVQILENLPSKSALEAPCLIVDHHAGLPLLLILLVVHLHLHHHLMGGVAPVQQL